MSTEGGGGRGGGVDMSTSWAMSIAAAKVLLSVPIKWYRDVAFQAHFQVSLYYTQPPALVFPKADASLVELCTG